PQDEERDGRAFVGSGIGCAGNLPRRTAGGVDYMTAAVAYKPGDLVRARGREWVVLPETRADLLRLRPLGGSEEDATLIYLPLEPEPPVAAIFDLPDPTKPGSQVAA